MKKAFINTPIGKLVDRISTWNPHTSPTSSLIDYIDISSINRETKQIDSITKLLTNEAPSRARQIAEYGDVLVSTVRPNLNAVAQVPNYLNGATASTGFTILRAKRGKLDARYLFHWVRTTKFVDQMFRSATGANYPAVSDRIIKESLIPLPPFEGQESIDEQKRIAAILDKADGLREKRRQAIAKLDTLLQSVFLDMFGDPVTNPKGWNVQPLDELLRFRTGKLDANAAVAGGAYPFFTCSREDYQIDTYAFDCEALLLAGNNATADYSVKYYKGRFNAYQRTYVITLLNPKHSYFYMRCALEKKLQDMKRLSKGTNTKYLTLSILQNLKIQVPLPDRQKDFEAVSLKINEHLKKHNESLRMIDNLFHSLQQRAFNGELFSSSGETTETATAAMVQPKLFD
jgi:type I restriction enzyme S subunit